MASQNSFDIVSEIDLAEVKNAVHQANKELGQRYDLKGTASEVELDEKVPKMVLRTKSKATLDAVQSVLFQKLAKRKIPLAALEVGTVEPASGDSVRQDIGLQQGIPTEKAKEIVKLVKTLKLKKVQVAIQGDSLRVTGKDRDALQEVIAAVKAADFGIAMQFTNFRSS